MPKTPKEKRLKRFRSSPSSEYTTIVINPASLLLTPKRCYCCNHPPLAKISERIDRAVHQRLFLVSISSLTTSTTHDGPSITLTVLGSTGNVYEVTISKVPKCSCPDNAKGNLCKHFLFVMLKVVGLTVDDALVYQSAYLTEELEGIINRLQNRTRLLGRDVVAIEAVQQQYKAMKKGEATGESKDEESKVAARKEIEGDCPICFDALESNQQLTYCQQACGSNFHVGCISIWTSQAAQRVNPTCPTCRQPWVDLKTGGKKEEAQRWPGDEGYTNLGSLQGQSAVRDTSTYHSSPYYGYKRRRYY
jgi:hypothetical protein